MKWLLAKAGKLFVIHNYNNLAGCFKDKSNLTGPTLDLCWVQLSDAI